MFRFLFMVWMLMLALLCASTVRFDGVCKAEGKGRTEVNLQFGYRSLAVGVVPIRSNRVYYRIAVY